MAFKSLTGAACAGLMLISFSANAALISRLGGLAYYDDVANLTWLADANGGDPDIASWASGTLMHATQWTSELVVAGNDNWRLPSTGIANTLLQCGAEYSNGSGYNCTDSELGNLFYNVLGGTAGVNIATSHNNNFDLFSNIQTGQSYWTSSNYGASNSSKWTFGMEGWQGATPRTNLGLNIWAVQSGDVSAVPLPAAAWLFISAIAGLAGAKRLSRSKGSA